MDGTAEVTVDLQSALLNRGQLFAPGSIQVPDDSSFSNEGILESDHDFDSNCYNDLASKAPLMNSGSFALRGSEDQTLQSCVDNLQHSGLLQLSGSNVTFNQVGTSLGSTITLQSSSIGISTGDPFASNGNVGGSGSFQGSFVNNRGATIMANGDRGTTKLDVQSEFRTSGTVFFMINSRDLSDPDALTQISANGIALDGGRACICFNPSLKLEFGDRWNIMEAQDQLNGIYDSVQFDCVECPRRSAKSVEGEKSECQPSADYGTRNMAVLFDNCDGGNGNLLERITPPWYVIFPVAVGIILCLIIFFGGALLVDEKLRKRKFKSKVRTKRSERIKRMAKQTTVTNSSSMM